MKLVYIRGGFVAKVSDEDFAFVSRFSWSKNKSGYAERSVCYKKLLMHQMLVDCKRGFFVDHIDGDRLNNTMENLRIVTPTQNQRNSRPRRGKKYKGIAKTSGGWAAKINFNRNPIHLGTFFTEEAAARAYDRKAHELDPEFSRLNFSEGLWTLEQVEEFRIRPVYPKSGFSGVQENGSGWAARVKRNGKNHYVGTFKSKEEAMTERNKFLANLSEAQS